MLQLSTRLYFFFGASVINSLEVPSPNIIVEKNPLRVLNFRCMFSHVLTTNQVKFHALYQEPPYTRGCIRAVHEPPQTLLYDTEKTPHSQEGPGGPPPGLNLCEGGLAQWLEVLDGGGS